MGSFHGYTGPNIRERLVCNRFYLFFRKASIIICCQLIQVFRFLFYERVLHHQLTFVPRNVTDPTGLFFEWECSQTYFYCATFDPIKDIWIHFLRPIWNWNWNWKYVHCANKGPQRTILMRFKVSTSSYISFNIKLIIKIPTKWPDISWAQFGRIRNRPFLTTWIYNYFT